MKNLIAVVVCALLLVAAPAAAQPADAQKDRAAAAKYLEETRQAFLKSIENVTPAQWTFKATPTSWSIAETAEHIGIAEGTILGMISTQMLKAPAPKPGETISDQKLIAGITDRSQKA
ncbi:MAG TPA: DinB family protein, partial [Vicinamibacterales bacterium]|nr:DinB family protein [Vicinamibacterales bacterium]